MSDLEECPCTILGRPSYLCEKQGHSPSKEPSVLFVRIKKLEETERLACAVADAWTTYKYSSVGFSESQRFTEAMERLELVTRASGMRKVRP